MSDNSIEAREYSSVKFSILRVIIFSLLLFVLISLELGLYHTAISDLCDNLMSEYELTDEKGWQKTVAWLVDQTAMMLPFVTICIFHFSVYNRYNRKDGIIQREMGYEVLLTALLVYAVLLPVVAKISRDMHIAAQIAGEVKNYDKGGPITLLRESVGWFLRFLIPVGILSLYHFSRAKTEIEDEE